MDNGRQPAGCDAMPRQWAGETVVLLAGGPSLSPTQLDIVYDARCRGLCRVVAINRAYEVAHWSDMLYFCDARFFDWHSVGVLAYRNWGGMIPGKGEIWTLDNPELAKKNGFRSIKNMGVEGFCSEPWGVMTGKNGGYQAMHLAAHAGASRLVLLGYDMRLGDGGATHWHNGYPKPVYAHTYSRIMLPHFDSLAAPLAERGVEVVNCSPGSALEVWPHGELDAELFG